MKAEIENIIAEFELLTDWQDKYMHIIEMGARTSSTAC